MVTTWYIGLKESVERRRRISTYFEVVSECHRLGSILTLQEIPEVFDDQIRVIVRLDEPIALVRQIRIGEEEGQGGLQS